MVTNGALTTAGSTPNRLARIGIKVDIQKLPDAQMSTQKEKLVSRARSLFVVAYSPVQKDPTEPVDSTQYMAQLASFSQVEQSVIMNKKLDSLLVASALQQIDGIIGRTLTTADESISGTVKAVWIYDEGAVAELEDGTRVLLGPGVKIS